MLQVTETDEQVWPSDAEVGAFKLAYMQRLVADGFTVDVAYGNPTADIAAYLGTSLPAGAISIIGQHGGEQGTNDAAGSWAWRVRQILALSADAPLPC